jgi:hypothetical protein
MVSFPFLVVKRLHRAFREPQNHILRARQSHHFGVNKIRTAFTAACFAPLCVGCVYASRPKADWHNATTDFLEAKLMTKTLLTAAALLLSVSFASAEDKMACDDATIMKMEEGAKAMNAMKATEMKK